MDSNSRQGHSSTRYNPGGYSFWNGIKNEPEDEEEDQCLVIDESIVTQTPDLSTQQTTRVVPELRHDTCHIMRQGIMTLEDLLEDGEKSFLSEPEPSQDPDYVELSDNSLGAGSGDVKIAPRVRQRNRKRKRPSESVQSVSSSSDGGKSSTRPMKMYELDVILHPEAAGARSSYETRIRIKAEKEEVMNQISFLKYRNRVLVKENAALKEILREYDSIVSAQDWCLFFRSAGIRSGDDRKYAVIFGENRIKSSFLLDLNEQWLREMNITAVGDILAILKHAQLVHAKTSGWNRATFHVAAPRT